MKNTCYLLVILLFLTMMSCQNKSNSGPISGLWSLHIVEQQDSTGHWHEWRDGMQGYILYDNEGHMALHLTTKGYEKTSLRFPNFNDTIPDIALKYLTNSYVYFANYEIDDKERIVTHSRISHSNPGEWNDIVKRRYSFIGDTLVLQPVEADKLGLRLKWIKQE